MFKYSECFKPSQLLLVFIAGLLSTATDSARAEESPEVLQLPPITVTADPLNPNLYDYGRPVAVMDEREITQRSATTLGETVGLEPGVSSSFFGQGSSRPVVRGFAGDRVRVLKNGVTTGDVSDLSEDHVVVADPLQASQIEILRGPETLLYGSGAIGGAVNVTDESIAEVPVGSELTGKILGQLGNSADNEKTLGAKLAGEIGKFNWYLSGFGRLTDDYEIPGWAESSSLRELEDRHDDHESEDDVAEDHDKHDHEAGDSGQVRGSNTESWGVTSAGSYVFDDGFWGLSVSGYGSDYGIPGHSHEDDSNDSDAEVRIDAEQIRIDSRGQIDNISESIESIKFRLGYSDYTHDEIEGSEVGTTYDRTAFDSRLELLHSKIGDLQGALGMQLLYDDFSATGEEAFLVSTGTWSPAVFIYEKLALSEDVDLQLGGRVEYVTHNPEQIDTESFIPFSLSFGPVWTLPVPGDYSVGLSFAYSERAPNAVELFADGVHVARQIFELGDSSLNKERSWGADLVFRKSTGLVTGAFTPFYQNFSNYINLAASGDEVEEFPIFAYEEIDAYFWGFELESALHVDKLLTNNSSLISFEHQIDFVRARNQDDSDDLPRIPPLRNILRVRYDQPDYFDAFVEGVFVEEQENISENELPTDSYVLLNAEIGFEPTVVAEGVRIFLRGSNLTDDEARVHSSFLKDLAPLRGRSFLFGFTGSF